MKTTATLPKLSTASKWMSYSGLATAFLAANSKADAQVIYTDVDPDATVANSTFDVDFDGDGTVDVIVSQFGFISGTSFSAQFDAITVPGGNALLGSAMTTSSGSSIAYPSVLASGAPIAPGDARFREFGSQFLAVAVTGYASGGLWTGQHGYMGCRFAIGAETHYGWVEMEVSADRQLVTVMGFAYEATPDVAINAGDVGAPTGVSDLKVPLRFGVFPNPARERVTIGFNAADAGAVQLSIVNGLGQVLSTEQVSVSAGENSLNLDMSAVPAGSYFVRMQNATQVAFQKVTKVN